jgi:chromate reductase, NAD(P)H dehydrogenase (quinone)
MAFRILGISGSLRTGSYNTALLRAAAALAPAGVEVEIFDRLRDIPPYDEDERLAAEPEPVQDLKRRIEAADALLIATPEYNHSIPGVLKNALDWASRPVNATPLRDKPVAVMGASGGLLGTVRAQAHLRQALDSFTPVLHRPEVLVSQAAGRFDEHGTLVDETSRALVAELVGGLVAWARRLAVEHEELQAAG